MKPLVSCIVPVFNGERYLAEALDSILAQTYRPVDLIVVDDGSTDGTAQVAAGYGERITYLYQENSGPAAARNKGIDAAQGEFVAFLDADDVWHEEKLARQMVRFDARRELGVCSAYQKNFWSPELEHHRSGSPDTGLDGVPPGVFSSAVVRRSLFDEIGFFDPTLKHRDDMEWLSRAADEGVVSETILDVLVFRRIHGANRSSNRGAADKEEILSVLKSKLDRRRGKLRTEE